MGKPAVGHMLTSDDALAQEFVTLLNGAELFGDLVGYSQTAGNIAGAVAAITGLAVADSDELTLSCWIKNSGVTWEGATTRRFLSWGDGTTGTNFALDFNHLSVNNFGLYVAIGDHSTSRDVTEGLPNPPGGRSGADWLHVCATRRGSLGSLILWVNGVEAETSSTWTGDINTADSDVLRLGSRHNTTSPVSSALIADLWIAQTQVSDAQMLALYNGGTPPNPGTDGTSGPYAVGSPLVFLGGPGYSWATSSTLENRGSLGDFTLSSGSITETEGAG